MSKYDIVTLGETMLRLTPPNHKRIEQATSFDIEIGGSESNTAIGLARLGLKVLWLSRLTNNPLGRLIERTIAGHGVDTSQVIWTENDRVGTYFLEEGKLPRGSRIIYDRAYSAISQMRPSELPRQLFRPGQAQLLHLTGITPALSATLASTAERALALAKEAGWRASFDLNYRSQLWTPAAALAGCKPFLEVASTVFAPLNDVRLLYSLDPKSTPEQALTALQNDSPQATVVLTLGKDGAIGGEPQGQTLRQPAFPAEEVGRVGGGDAFTAGFLYGYLITTNTRERLARALRWGAAAAALKYSIPGDIPFIDRSEVASLVEQDTVGPELRR